MESNTESELISWSAPPCPFSIEYTPRVLDDIRLAVVDAFFSLPRGGAEIGGILLGRHEKGRVLILDYVALPCEHASGPSFVLSARDHGKLAEMLAVARGNAQAAQPVGWYHSHTRSEIFLSEADLAIHKRYFPEPWQVALVLKPHTFRPTRAGFFFREQDGSIRETECYREFEMEPLAVRPIPDAAAAVASVLADLPLQPAPEPRPAETAAGAAAVTPEAPAARTRAAEAQPARPRAAETQPARTRAAETQPARTRRPASLAALRVWAFLLALVLGLAFAAWAYYTRELWLPTLLAAARPRAAFVGLNTIDVGGQLQIRWDRNSRAVREARDGILTIDDGPAPEAIELDSTHLKTGVFTYARKGARIDVAMTLNEPDGEKVHEATSYLGTAPQSGPAADSSALRKERDELARSLEAERERSRKLEKQIQKAQRKRLANQSR
jgi:proteasome lid subunit RPN8/RPN11